MDDNRAELLMRQSKEEVYSLDFREIRDQVRHNYESMRNLRENRKQAIQQYMGWSHSEAGSDKQVPVNIIEMQVSILSNWLAPGIPRVSVRSRKSRLLPSAARLEAGLNRWMDDTNFHAFLQLYLKNAIFCMGVAKVGLVKTGVIEIDGRAVETTAPFTDNVDFDDFVFDFEVPRKQEIGLYGNKYRMPLDAAMRSQDFLPDARKELVERELNAGADAGGGMQSERIGTGGGAGDSRRSLVRCVELVDVFLPYHKLIITFPWDAHTWRPLFWRKWNGPKNGPYRILGFDVVPGKVVPLAPVMTAMPLHTAINAAYRKILRQLERQKSHFIYGDAEDAEKLLKEPDGAALKIADPAGAKEVRWGGADQNSVAIVTHLRQLATYMLGNLDSLGGLQSRADTLGQEKMMASTASLKIQAMQHEVYHTVRGIVRDVAEYIWSDPLVDLRGSRRVGISGREVSLAFTPDTREGQIKDYDIDIEPYSMEPSTPSERVSRIVQVVQLLGGLGVMPDPAALTSLLARYLDQPELEQLYGAVMMEDMQQGGPVKPAETTRNYNRTSQGGMSQTGGENQMIQAMLSGSRSGGNSRGG